MKTVLFFLSMVFFTLVGVYASENIRPKLDNTRNTLEQRMDALKLPEFLECIKTQRELRESLSETERLYEQCEFRR